MSFLYFLLFFGSFYIIFALKIPLIDSIMITESKKGEKYESIETLYKHHVLALFLRSLHRSCTIFDPIRSYCDKSPTRAADRRNKCSNQISTNDRTSDISTIHIAPHNNLCRPEREKEKKLTQRYVTYRCVSLFFKTP